MKKTALIVVLGLLALGGGYFASLHISKEKPKTESDLAIQQILESSAESAAEKGSPEQGDINILSTGAFNPDAEGSDDFHRASGDMQIVDFQGEKKLVLEENFTVTNGPDYMVYLVRGEVPQTDEAYETGRDSYTNLGRMRQFDGYQTFDIPEQENLGDVTGVVIWCEQFSVFVSSGALEVK